MKNEKFPFVSIILCTYNEEKTVGEAVESLLNQSYPKDKYEIIAIDDCSSDKTCEVLFKYPFKLIKKKKNEGIASSRNIGLKLAKGEIYVCFDGDCVANKNWLKHLVKTYIKNPSIAGVCGAVYPYDESKIGSRFLQDLGEGNPYFFDSKKSDNPISRFIYYVKRKSNGALNNKSQLVCSMPGSNSSFKTKVLKEVGGWDETSRLAEDTVISRKIFRKYKDRAFLFNKKAKLKHRHPSDFFNQLKRKYKKGIYTFKYYKEYKISLPIYPFPLGIILISILFFLLSPLYFLISLIVSPPIFYFWYTIKFFKSFNLDYFIFPYMTFLWEFSENLGVAGAIIKNAIKNNKK